MKNNNYKQTEIGEIPEDWILTTLGEISDIASSKRIFASEYQNDGIPFLRGKEIIEKHDGKAISTELFITQGKYNEIKNKYGTPETGDILLTSVGTIGIPYRVDTGDKFYFKDGNLTWFRHFKGVDSKFLYFWLESSIGRSKLIESSIGSTQQALIIDALKKIELALPLLEEQKQIASILASLDDKIELNRKMNKTLEEIGKVLFKRWFVDFEFPFDLAQGKSNLDGKSYKSSGGEMVDSELGEIPEGWEVKKLKEICSITNGGTPSRQISKYWENKDILWIKTGELDDGVILDSEEKISKLGLQNSSAKLLPVNSVVIAIYAAPTVGRLGILKHEAATNQACTGLVAKNEYVSYMQIYYWLLFLRSYYNSIAVGAAQQNISKQVIEETQIVLPPKRVIENSKAILESIWDEVTQNTVQISNLSQIRDSLLPRLMSGRLRVIV